MPSHIIESELFGHEPGAFTSATGRRRGRFEMAQGGTIFLDEISEIPFDLQAKLLGVLQDRKFERVGGSKTISVNVRVIAATNRKLKDEIAAGRFRADLYYRLNIFPITVPPLRNRRDDIPSLVEYFVGIFAKKNGKTIDQIPKAVLESLVDYQWPGNIRELKNIIERACITCPGPKLCLPQSISLENSESSKNADSPGEFLPLQEIERRHILKVLEETDWRINGDKGAAKILNINPSTLRGRIKKLGLKH
jgi:formate hydrogenlyase transcriptional activator